MSLPVFAPSAGPVATGPDGWVRRARPVLGTLVEIGLPADRLDVLPTLWAVLDTVQQRMSVHEPDSDLSRLHAAAPMQAVQVHPWTAAVLHLAQAWHRACPAFDVALGTGLWRIKGELAWRIDATTQLDLGGLAKGWGVDRVIDAARNAGVHALWVNAGGDLRTAGVALPVQLRDELCGGAYPWGVLEDGALATSDFRSGARSVLWSEPGTAPDGKVPSARHISVMADRCATADVLTKVVAALGLSDPRIQVLLQAHGAQAWVHDGD